MEVTKNVIKIGEYIILQKQDYRKLLKFNKPDTTVTLGRDTINLNGIEGKPYFSYFKITFDCGGKNIPRKKKYTVEYTEETVTLKDEIDIKVSGNDNRNILDDGRSQKLSAADIEILKSDASRASDIVETLITNSNTFHNKTEFSQEKYLKKKEKKYFEYIQILKPNLRMVAEILYVLAPQKIQQIRLDTLSQIITMTNINCEGVHLLYDSGSNGLLPAAILSVIGERTNGKLVLVHPGNMSQKLALLALNFEEEQYKRCISANVYSVLRQSYQGTDTNSNGKENNAAENSCKRKTDDDSNHNNKKAKLDNLEIDEFAKAEGSEDTPADNSENIEKENLSTVDNGDNSDTEETNTTVLANANLLSEPTKPKWHFDTLAAAELLKNKVDSLAIVCKEDPHNIFDELVNFVKPGRPFTIYHTVAEPLQNLYVSLKPRSNVSALRLTSNWMRNYQVLPDRTHPEVTMNRSSGFLLSGYILK